MTSHPPHEYSSLTGEQTGVLWTFERDADAAGGWRKLEEPFLNISVFYEFPIFDAQGFLALQFHPDFDSNGLMYSWYSVFYEDTGRTTRLSEFRVCITAYYT